MPCQDCNIALVIGHVRRSKWQSRYACGRIRQDSQGRYCIEVDSGAEIPFTSRDHLKLTLQDVPSTFVRLHIPDCTPDNTLLPIFLEQLHPHLLIAGKEALLQIRLTQLSDGCVLGVSVSHMLAGAATDVQRMLARETPTVSTRMSCAAALPLTHSSSWADSRRSGCYGLLKLQLALKLSGDCTSPS